MQVNVPSIGLVNFPDSMSQDEVAQTIKEKLLPQVSRENSYKQGNISNPYVVPHQSLGQKLRSDTSLEAVLGQTIQQSGNELGQSVGRSMGLQGIPEQPQPQTYGRGLHQGAVNVVGALANPKTLPLALAFPASRLLPFGPLLLKGALAGMVTPGVAQSLGVLSPGSGATGPERLQTGVEGGVGALGYLPLGSHFVRPTLQEVPTALKPVQDLNRELTVQERNTRAQTLRSPSPTKASTSPVEQVNVTPPDETGKSQPVALPSQPTGATPLSPEEAAERAAHKELLKTKTPDELRQMIVASKAKALELVKQNPALAYKEAVFNQQYPREELKARGEPLEAPLDMVQVAHSYQRPATSLQLMMQDAVKSGAITKEQQVKYNRQIFNAHQILVQKANDKTMTTQDRDSALGVLKQINTEVQNAIQKSSTGTLGQQPVGTPSIRGQGSEGVEPSVQGKEVAKEGGQVQTQGQSTQGKVQTAPKEKVPQSVPGAERTGGVGNGEGDARVVPKGIQVLLDTPEKNLNDEQRERLATWRGQAGSIFPKLQKGGTPTKMLGPDRVPTPQSLVSKVLPSLDSRNATGSDILRAVANSAFVNRRKGYDFPAMQSAHPDLANSAASYGNAAMVGKLEAQQALGKLGEGLPTDEGFWKKVGAVIYEDMRRAGGEKGNSVFELKNTPLANEAAYQAALKDANIRKAIDQWKEHIQEPATQMHVQLGGSLLDVGEETGAFANLKALLQEPDTEYTGTSPQSGPMAALKGRTSFGQQRKYTGTEYSLDARELGLRMLTKNYAKVQKDNFYKTLEQTGQGKLIKNPSEAPSDMQVLANPVRMRTIVAEKDGKTTIVPQNEWLAVKPKILPETEQLLQVNTSFGKLLQRDAPVLSTVNHALLRVQVGLGIDLGFHTANDFAATLQAFKYNVPRAAISGTKGIIDYVRQDPKVQEEILNMAREGVTFRGQNAAGLGSRTLKFVDTVTRLVLNREYERQVAAKKLVDSPAERRRYVNARAGQYNKRFMTYFQQSAQESALGAFNVAGRNFNRLSVRAVMGTPGAKAPTINQALINRLSVATGLAVFALATPAIYNEAKWGTPQPDGTRPGEIAISKNPDGTYKVVDMFKLSLVGRAGRATGAGTILDEQVMPALRGEQRPPISRTLEHAGTTALATTMQPFWGPPLSAASALATGQTIPGIGFNEKTPGETGPPYWRAGLSSVNPIAGPVASAGPEDISLKGAKSVLGGIGQRVGGVIGLKQTPSAYNRVAQWSDAYKQRNNIRTDSGDFSPSEYKTLKSALLSGDVDAAKEAYQQLLHQKSQRGDMSDTEAQQQAKDDMQKYFSHLVNFNFVNKEDEAKFMAGLTPKQREIYKEAQQQLKGMADMFFSQIQPKEVKQRQKFEIRGPSLRHF